MWPFRRRPAAAPVPVSLPAQVEAIADELAEAYVSARPEVSRLLANHAAAAGRLDAAVIDPHAEPWQLAFLAAEAEGTRTALLTLSPTAQAIARTTPETTE